MACLICALLAGEGDTPRVVVHEGQWWQLEHAQPTALRGWLRLILKRHAEALHELTDEEWDELRSLLQKVTRALKAETGCEKEYLMCFSEGEGTRHLHLHVVAKPADLPDDAKGAKVFTKLNVGADVALTVEEMTALGERLQPALT